VNLTSAPLHNRFLRPPHNPAICACMSVAIGSLYLLGPDVWFVSPAYSVAYSVLPRPWWGIVFFVPGIAVLGTWSWPAWRRRSIGVLLAVFLTWTLCLTWSAHLHNTVGFTGSALWLGVCVMLGTSLVRYGSGSSTSR
jgi:hypothetical protein